MSDEDWADVPKSICEVMLDVLIGRGLHVPVPRGMKPPPVIVALYEAAEAHYAPVMRRLVDCVEDARDERDTARTFLASIASAQSQGTREQTDWMIEQAIEGLRRAGGHDFDSEVSPAPQGDDHEAHEHWFCEMCETFDGPVSDGACDVCAHDRDEHIVPIRLARVSPSRDGTVAVEEERHHFNCQVGVTGKRDECNCMPARWVRVTGPAAFSRSSSGRPEQPSPDALGGLPPLQPKEDEERRS